MKKVSGNTLPTIKEEEKKDKPPMKSKQSENNLSALIGGGFNIGEQKKPSLFGDSAGATGMNGDSKLAKQEDSKKEEVKLGAYEQVKAFKSDSTTSVFGLPMVKKQDDAAKGSEVNAPLKKDQNISLANFSLKDDATSEKDKQPLPIVKSSSNLFGSLTNN